MNKLLKQLQDAKQQGFVDGVWQGLALGINIALIAINHTLGIGKKRFASVYPEITRLIDEIRVDDPLRAEKQIKEAFDQIK